MPVSGFTPVIVSNNSSSSMAVSPPNCSSPLPTNCLPQQNGQNVEMDCISLSSKVSSAEQMISDSDLMDDFSNQLSISPKSTSDLKDSERREMEMCTAMFDNWPHGKQTEFVQNLVESMSFHQHERIYSILLPLLQRDFVTQLPGLYMYM